MATTETTIEARPEDVFAVVADPTTYPSWLPGARRIRRVEDEWPEPGSAFHHEVGAGPIDVNDATSVLDTEPPHELVLRAGIGRFGSALIRFQVDAVPTGAHVRMVEEPEQGFVRAVADHGGRSLVEISTWARNALALHRLRRVVLGPSGADRS